MRRLSWYGGRAGSSTPATCSRSRPLLLSPCLLSLGLARPMQTSAQVAASGRRRARRRQPHPGASPHVGQRRRADAVTCAGGRVRRHGARQLRLDHRLDGNGAQPRSLRHAVGEHRHSHDPVPAGNEGAGRHLRRLRASIGADGARRAHRVPADAGDGRRRRDREHRADGAPQARGGRCRRHVPADGVGPGPDGVRQPRAAAAPEGRRGGSSCRRPTASSGCRSPASSSTTPTSRARS